MGKPRSRIEPKGLHLLTSKQAYQGRLNQAKAILYGLNSKLYKGKGLTPKKLIRQAHEKAIIQALAKNVQIPIDVLQEYQHYRTTADLVKQYAKSNQISFE